MYRTKLARRRLTPCLLQSSGWNWEVNDDEIWVGWDGKGAAAAEPAAGKRAAPQLPKAEANGDDEKSMEETGAAAAEENV